MRSSSVRCRVCERPIFDGEPFTTVGVAASERVAQGAVHYACTITTIAGECARQVLDALESGEVEVRVRAEGAREDDPLREKLHRLFADLVDEVIE